MNSATCFKKSALRSAVLHALSVSGMALTLGAGVAHGAPHTGTDACNTVSSTTNNFTMLTGPVPPTSPAGGVVGGNNVTDFTWDGTWFDANTDYTGPGSGGNHATLSSTAAFFGHNWTAHDVQIFGPGTYTFDPTLGGGVVETGTVTMTVLPGQLGAHMLFDWNANNNIDVAIVWNTGNFAGAAFSGPWCLSTGPTSGGAGCSAANNPAGNTSSTVYMLASIDPNGDGVNGVPMPAGGPFAGFNANFNLKGTLSGPANGVCAPALVDTVPDPFSFATSIVHLATFGQTYISNTITVTGINAPSPISVTGGQYAVSTDGGKTFSPFSTSVPATVSNNDIVKVQGIAPLADNQVTNVTLTIGGVPGTFSIFTPDTIPNAFSFGPAVTGATPSTPTVSPPITVSGIDAPSAISISSSNASVFAYAINGGSYTNNPGTVNNGDTVTIQVTSAPTAGTPTDVTLTIGGVSSTFSVITAGGASKSSTGNNFTMLDVKPDGGVDIAGGTNDVAMFWDGQFNTSTSDPVTPATAHMRLASATPFFGHNWTAHHISVFGPGTYVINVDCSVDDWQNGTCTPNANPARNYTFTVGASQIGAHMLFDWNGTLNIDVINVWDQNTVFAPSPLYTGQNGFNAPATSWNLMSSDTNASCPGAVDGNGAPINCGINGINGTGMIDGPFLGFMANFNINFVGTTSAGNYQPTVNVGDPSNSPGCSVSSTPGKALKRGDLWLLAGFLAWLGGIRMRLRRKTQS